MITECRAGPSGPAKQTPDLKVRCYTWLKAIPVRREEDRSESNDRIRVLIVIIVPEA